MLNVKFAFDLNYDEVVKDKEAFIDELKPQVCFMGKMDSRNFGNLKTHHHIRWALGLCCP